MMEKQFTSSILMIRPRLFNYNAETASNNYYQKIIDGLTPENAQEKALVEFDQLVLAMRNKGIDVVVVDDTPDHETPDSIFPNNWISTHEDGSVYLYPMFARSRRGERRLDIPENILPNAGFAVKQIIDLSDSENAGQFLEGTGSLMLDRENEILFASISDRTNKELVQQFAVRINYKPITFTSFQTVEGQRLPIYHTNVMMCVGDQFAILCADAIDNGTEKNLVITSLEQSQKEIIEITEDQANHFAGNMLQLGNKSGNKYLVMSTAAFNSLDEEQILKIEKYCEIIHSNLDTIEACGGGSARCMIAEVFLPHI